MSEELKAPPLDMTGVSKFVAKDSEPQALLTHNGVFPQKCVKAFPQKAAKGTNWNLVILCDDHVRIDCVVRVDRFLRPSFRRAAQRMVTEQIGALIVAPSHRHDSTLRSIRGHRRVD